MVRLCDHGHWFASTESDTDPDQPRVGRRMALLAVVPGENSPICLVSTHLESNADAPYRDVQFDMLMDAIDAFAPKMPVLIGGDLNTGNHLPPDFDWRRETLFARADARGFSGQTRALIPALAPSAKPLSDHDAVCCRVHSGRVTKVSHS
jgi:endonuclease/exonuclease/phosphatase family metal-dependent hydrolase